MWRSLRFGFLWGTCDCGVDSWTEESFCFILSIFSGCLSNTTSTCSVGFFLEFLKMLRLLFEAMTDNTIKLNKDWIRIIIGFNQYVQTEGKNFSFEEIMKKTDKESKKCYECFLNWVHVGEFIENETIDLGLEGYFDPIKAQSILSNLSPKFGFDVCQSCENYQSDQD